jgi:hypothetical protein
MNGLTGGDLCEVIDGGFNVRKEWLGRLVILTRVADRCPHEHLYVITPCPHWKIIGSELLFSYAILRKLPGSELIEDNQLETIV